MKLRYDTYCGLFCGACPVGMANETGDVELLEKMAEEWGRSPDELRCGGCRSGITAVFCTDCEMRACAVRKGLEYCSQCDEYPCGTLTGFRNDQAPHHSAVLRNLSRMAEMGVEEWLEEETVRWTCGKCGKRFGWYSETCRECGEALFNSVLEERELET
ncbi:MAG: DUF3795 domain-containing protein [Candidatus Fermentibacteraceae bacterium]|nr:DUF3795 domain-containing protein [Candidatus Fermentibacteraceae bacterium]MBN2608329.1 DUF3795 domain-containing protein [Candidatus Fermentibacteraceae bacterium]